MATETTITSAKAWAPDLSRFAPIDVISEALILQTSTVTGRVEGDEPAVHVAYVDDAAAAFVAEGVAIDESNPDLAEVLVYTGKVSQLIRLSREQFSQEGTDTMLSESVRRAVVKKANAAYLTQTAPTPPAVTPPAGLINVAGIDDGGAVAVDLDALIDVIADLEANDSNPTHIVCHPVAWASLRKFKTATDSAQSLLGAGTTDADRMLLDLPVIVTNALASGTGMVLDRSAIVSAVGDVLVARSEHLYFDSDSIALRCTWRFGANLVHPDRVAKFTVTAPA